MDLQKIKSTLVYYLTTWYRFIQEIFYVNITEQFFLQFERCARVQ